MPRDILLEWSNDGSAPAAPEGAVVSGASWCWFDGQCDNADALIRASGMPPEMELGIAILSAWQERGEKAFDAIEGVFALVLFDGDRLVLARDAFGGRSLHFAHSGGTLRVARGPLALARACGRPRPDAQSLAGFALGLSEDGCGSFFEGVSKVGAGEVVTFREPTAAIRRRWWTPDFDRFKGSQADAIELMGTLLGRSVEGVLGHASRPALELSAGLDSNLLLGVAAPHARDLLAISGGPAPPYDPIPGNLVDETDLAGEAARSIGVSFAQVLAPPSGILDAARHFESHERPINNPSNVSWMDAVHHRGREHGADVLIQGSQGNFTTSWTGEYGLSQAITQRDLRSGAIELCALAGMGWRHAGATVKGVMRDRLPQWAVSAAIERSFAELSAMRHVDPDHESLASLKEREAGHRHLPSRWEHRAADPEERLRRWIASVDVGLYNRAIEQRFGMTPRDPFASRALVEASLSMPAHLFRDHQGERAIARQLLDPRLPSEIREGGPPSVQGAGWRHALIAERDELVALIDCARGDPLMRGLFNLETLSARLRTIPTEPVRTMAEYMTYRFDLAPALTALAFSRWVEEAA